MDEVMKRRISLVVLVTGISGIVAQVVLLRDLMVTFLGNELSIGIVLANWLLLEAIGSFFLGRKIERFRNRVEAFIIIQLIFCISFPVAVHLVKMMKPMVGIGYGEGVGFFPMLLSSFAVLLPVCLPHGASFGFACKIYSSGSKEDASAVGSVYVLELAGAIIGGVALTYLLIPNFLSIQIALGVSLTNLLACTWLWCFIYMRKPRVWVTAVTGLILGACMFIGAWVLFSPGAEQIHRQGVKRQWGAQKVIFYENSIYGNVAATRREGQYTFYSDGVPIITSPTPDIARVEEFAHFPLLLHPEPQRVLVISGGAGGLIAEILKHPTVNRVDYTELDPLILKTVDRFPTSLTENELHDERVRIEYEDGRLYLKKQRLSTYDLIFVGVSAPLDLQNNRMFTREFFSLAKDKLKPEGILAICLPGSLNYLSVELKKLNMCILSTLKKVYPYVKVVPGQLNLYCASCDEQVIRASPSVLIKRLKSRNISARTVNPFFLKYRFDRKWLDWFRNAIEDVRVKLNTDFAPHGLFYGLAFWNALFSPYMQNVFKWMEGLRIEYLLVPLVLLTIVLLLIGRKVSGRFSNLSVFLAITTTGFAGMMFELVLIFAFQVVYGYVYYWIGLLITAFMAGSAVGGFKISSCLNRIASGRKILMKFEAAFIIFSFVLPVIFLNRRFLPVEQFFVKPLFLFLSFIPGLLVGLEFPLGNRICLRNHAVLGYTAGLLYAGDLMGGWFAGVLGAVVLLPVFGLAGACMVVAVLKIMSLVILAGGRQPAYS